MEKIDLSTRLSRTLSDGKNVGAIDSPTRNFGDWILDKKLAQKWLVNDLNQVAVMQLASDYFPLLKHSNVSFESGHGWISNLYDASGWWLGYRVIHGNEEYGLTITSYDWMRRQVSDEIVRFSLQDQFFSSEIKLPHQRVLRREFRVVDYGLIAEDTLLESGDVLRHQIWSCAAGNHSKALSLEVALEHQDWHVQIQDGADGDVGQRMTHFDPSHFLVNSVNWNRGLCYLEHYRPVALESLRFGYGINDVLNRCKLLDTLENSGYDPNAVLTKDFLVFRSPFRFGDDVISSIKNRSRSNWN